MTFLTTNNEKNQVSNFIHFLRRALMTGKRDLSRSKRRNEMNPDTEYTEWRVFYHELLLVSIRVQLRPFETISMTWWVGLDTHWSLNWFEASWLIIAGMGDVQNSLLGPTSGRIPDVTVGLHHGRLLSCFFKIIEKIEMRDWFMSVIYTGLPRRVFLAMPFTRSSIKDPRSKAVHASFSARKTWCGKLAKESHSHDRVLPRRGKLGEEAPCKWGFSRGGRKKPAFGLEICVFRCCKPVLLSSFTLGRAKFCWPGEKRFEIHLFPLILALMKLLLEFLRLVNSSVLRKPCLFTCLYPPTCINPPEVI